jgi:hypothetical protein
MRKYQVDMLSEFSRRYFPIRSAAALAPASLGNHIALARLLASLQESGLSTPHSESPDEEIIIYNCTLQAGGNRQPPQPLWNGGGYLWNGMDRVNFHVQA